MIAAASFQLKLSLTKGEQYTINTLLSIAEVLVIGSAIGLMGAGIIIILIKRYWVPDYLQNPFTLMIVVSSFTASNIIQSESGLFTVTLMGILLANQKWVFVKHIVEFKETLRVLLISGLFIILTARLTVDDIRYVADNKNSLIFLILIIFVVRPLAVILSTFMSNLNIEERVFLSWMAPRGIIAAAVSSVFAERLKANIPETELLVPLTFLIITGTVATYGLTASTVAKWLGLAKPNPQGILLLGSHKWGRDIAKILINEGFGVLLVDYNKHNLLKARKENIPTSESNILSENALEEINLENIGRLIALTCNEEVNSLAVLHFSDVFDRSQTFQISQKVESENDKKGLITPHLRGRQLFGPDITFAHISELVDKGAVIKIETLEEDFDYDSLASQYGDSAIPMFLVNDKGELEVFATENPPSPKQGQKLILLSER